MKKNEIEDADQVNVGKSVTLARVVKNQNYSEFIEHLSDDQKAQYLTLASNIDSKNVNSVQTYGAELNKIIANNGEELLSQVRNGRNNELVKLTTDLLGEIKDINISSFEPRSRTFLQIIKHIPILGRIASTVEQSITKYDTVTNKVGKISDKISEAKSVALQDNNTLQKIFDNSLNYTDKIKDYIISGKIKLQELEAELENMENNPDQFEHYEVAELQNYITLFQKRVADMQTTEYILNQNLLQIKATQANNLEIANKSDNIINHVLPIWKSQLALSLIIENQKNSVESQRKVQEVTQEILKKNAAALKDNTITVAKQSEKSIIEMDTIRETTQKLIESIREVQQIHTEGEKLRDSLENYIQEYSNKLCDAIRDSAY